MRKVLIIDGDQEFLEMALSFLTAYNFSVACADSLDQGRTMISEFGPDLILLNRDLMSDSGRLIPDGFDILREIKTNSEWQKIPVILLINEASEQDLQNLRLLKYKADDYACKPIADNDLLRRIENLIGFDPDETTDIFMKEKNNFSNSHYSSGPGDNPELAEVAHKEIEELLTRLGEEVIQSKKGAEALKPGASKDHLRAEFELLQTKLGEQEKRYQRTRDKSRKAIEVLEKRILKLENDKQDLESRVFASETAIKQLLDEKQAVLYLLEKAREQIQLFLNLKDSLENEGRAAQEFLKEVEQFKK
jgi:DNA-binding response OmpR family regulator